MDNRQDLPGLEEVEWQSRLNPIPYLIGFWTLVFSTSFVLIIYLAFFDSTLPPNEIFIPLSITGAGTAASIWVLMSPLLDHTWRTAPDGLRIQGLIRKKLIKWSDIKETDTRWIGRWLCKCYILRTGKGTVVIPLRNIQLAASIRQYMDHWGNTKKLMLTPEIASLWHPALDYVAEEVSWTSERWSDLSVLKIRYAVQIIGCSLLVIWFLINRWFTASAITAIVAYIIHSSPQLKPKITWHADATKEGMGVLAVAGFGSVAYTCEFEWNSITRAAWQGDGLYLRIGAGINILIPWHKDEISSTRLILSIISQLRSVPGGVLVPIPKEILGTMEEPAK